MPFLPHSGRGSVSAPAEHEPRDDRPAGRQQFCRLHSHREQPQQAAFPIFIHSSWRASHTWFWLKFRSHPSTACYYEPFHEGLATLTRSEALSLGPKSWNSGHPVSEPYFLEFVPLIRQAGGVRLFVPEISYRWFLPVGGPTGDLRPKEQKYLALLIRHAQRLRRIPVFGFTRSLGRLAAIKNRFPGIHILQCRNLWTGWMSFVRNKQDGNPYFLRQLLHIMAEAQEPYFSAIINRYLVRYLPFWWDERGKIHATGDAQLITTLLELMSEQELFVLYMAFYTYLYMSVRESADIVLDITKIARDEGYRQLARDQLTSATGLPITFHDVTDIQQYCSFDPTLIDWKEVRGNLDFAVQMLDHVFDRGELLRYGTELLDETLTEIKTSEKYVATARHEIAKVASERDAITAARSTLNAERDRLTAERDAALAGHGRLTAERDAALAEHARFTAERDTALAEHGRLTAERDTALAEHGRLTAERDTALAEHGRLTAERDAALAERARLTTERDTALAEHGRLTTERDAALAERDAALAEQDRLAENYGSAMAGICRLSGEIAAQESALAALRTELSQLATDRDRLAAQSERWFNAAVVWAAGRLLSTPRLRRGQRFQRLMMRFRAGPINCWTSRVNHKDSPRIRANRARDAREWELAARFYVDELNRNAYDPTVWVQLGYALKEAGKTSAAEIAYSKAETLHGDTLNALLPLAHLFTKRQQRSTINGRRE
jgi:cell division protein FtsL